MVVRLEVMAKAVIVATANGAAANDRHQTKSGMKWRPGGTSWLGSTEPSLIDVRPVHQVRIDGFWIDKAELSNSEFSRFIHSTGYKTVAERKPDAKDFPAGARGKGEPSSGCSNIGFRCAKSAKP
jgi:formylglycine-generating enzyme required for sulfatase activity